MKCKKCGNEILDGEKFCGKCGTKVELNIERETNNIKEKKNIKIKPIYLIIGIIAIILIISMVIMISNNQSTVVEEASTSSNRTLNENKILDCIDVENKQFKINIDDLTNELKKIKLDEETANREAFKSEYEVISQDTTDENGNSIKVYMFINKLGKYNKYYLPPFMFATNSTNKNIFQIAILHEYEADYGTNSLKSSDYTYTWLYKALNNLGQNELSQTIKEVRANIKDFSSETNIRGIYFKATEAGENRYGNNAGYYFSYFVKQ